MLISSEKSAWIQCVVPVWGRTVFQSGGCFIFPEHSKLVELHISQHVGRVIILHTYGEQFESSSTFFLVVDE